MTESTEVEELTETERLVLDILKQRRKKGRETYGKGIDYKDEKYNWNDEILDEILDALTYFAAQKLRMRDEERRKKEEIE